MSAPSQPLTYDQAVAMAAALAASKTTPDPAVVVAGMAEKIIATREATAAWAKNAIRRLWVSVNPYDAMAVQAFAAQAATIMQAAQTAAGRVAAAAQAQQLAALGVAVAAAPSLPLDVRAPSAAVKRGQLVLHQAASTIDYDGAGPDVHVSKADMTTAGVFERPAAVYRYAKSIDAADPAAQAGQRIDELVDGNLMLSQRLAQQQVLVQAGAKVTGYRRVIHPELSRTGTCGMCIAAADRVYKVDKLMPIHAHCKCTIAPVTDEHDPGDDANGIGLAQLYGHAGGNTVAHLKRTRYAIDEHGELGPVLVPKKAYKPRSAGSKKTRRPKRAAGG
ncbi:hypothetical protein [Mycobacterium avium]|uniref:hypothetical protein n=1 Tax=Mycobacterium avium TaxID=1764 RepID=UPI00030C31D0|nr:hypothetical protein [Mycobacterium avium]MBZ4500176.1 hypothetical protein [Mycobacterium avium subsp. hominissuis]MBZ4547759.1 hypothetical protein [Mycobacterium avium subsp. hominissuis]MBZ4600356.1 hypothetical protein [Mycobacterium avium subsp. hominissuis]MDO2381963.1 hypothetical protein [Mycobacterium avium subsp. hominissuis]MDO2394526.1 hypothetical protein [Mycobacterium avium subsp. hominissuis]